MSKIWTPFQRATPIPASEETVQSVATAHGLSYNETLAIFKERENDAIWRNSLYQVVIDTKCEQRDGWPDMIHLSIKRNDRAPIHDWRDLQRIKNELIGPTHEAVELYPSEDRVTDLANQYHLWVLADPKIRFPIGWNTRAVSSIEAGGSKQRKFDSD